MAEINYKIDPSLKPIYDRIKNKRKLYRELAGILGYAVEMNLETEGSRLPGGWPELAQNTRKTRSRKGTWPGKMLQETGQLAASIQQFSDDDYAAAGTNLRYAALMNYGGTVQHQARSETFRRKRKRKGKFKKGTVAGRGFTFRSYSVDIPARPYLTINDEDAKKIHDKIRWFLKAK